MHYKECWSLVKKVTNKLKSLVPPVVNGSKFEVINIMSRNPVRANHEIYSIV